MALAGNFSMTRVLFCLLFFSGVLTAFAAEGHRIAVMPFRGDKSVTPEQLDFITGNFTSELIEIGGFTVLDRNNMDVILREQGFQQSGACNSSECQVEIGQLLGVDYLVNGNMVKFGPEFAFRLEYLDVSTGQVKYTVKYAKEGQLHKVYKVACQELAKGLALKAGVKTKSDTESDAEVADAQQENEETEAAQSTGLSEELFAVQPEENLKPSISGDAVSAKPSDRSGLSTKRKIALGMLAPVFGGLGGGYYFDGKGVEYGEDYDAALAVSSRTDAQKAYDNEVKMENYRNISYGLAVGTLVIGLGLWFLPE